MSLRRILLRFRLTLSVLRVLGGQGSYTDEHPSSVTGEVVTAKAGAKEAGNREPARVATRERYSARTPPNTHKDRTTSQRLVLEERASRRRRTKSLHSDARPALQGWRGPVVLSPTLC